MEMTDLLFEDIINTAQDCVFWKDSERRFAGVNQAFLDFYGFDSADVLIGKTDEDMGWHNDPDPYMQDELRVLQGESTYKVQGRCMVRGRERDIVASKRPLYRDGKIVGLVGSFMDVTEAVRRRNALEKAQILYSAEQLRVFPYFDRLLDEVNIENVLDQLTGIVSRTYLLDFARSLTAAGTPFAFIIFDLDNFKYINDNYGHQAGDRVLMSVAQGLVSFAGGSGIAGRFGGDELLMIHFGSTDAADRKKFFRELYENSGILRRSIDVDGHAIYVTVTSGCAAYPDDADNFEDLFALTDKTLYNGKSIGRNCFTVYEERKHKDLEIKKIAGHGVYTSMSIISAALECGAGFEDKLRRVMPVIADELHISDLYYMSAAGCLRSASDAELRENAGDTCNIMTDDIYSANELDEIKNASPMLYRFLEKRRTEAVLIVRIGIGDDTFGYLVCAEPKIKRIWQEEECGIMYFLAKQLAAGIRYNGESIPC